MRYLSFTIHLIISAIAVSGCGGFTHKAEPVKLEKGGTVWVAPPQFKVFEIGVAQMLTERADLGAAANANLQHALTRALASLGSRPIIPDLSPETANELEQRTTLFHANRLLLDDLRAKAARPHKNEAAAIKAIEKSFRASIGTSPGLQAAARKAGVRYLIVSYGTDSYLTGGARALGVVTRVAGLGMTGTAIAGSGMLTLGVADLHSGEVVWYATKTSFGDVQTEPVLYELAVSLLKNGMEK